MPEGYTLTLYKMITKITYKNCKKKRKLMKYSLYFTHELKNKTGIDL